jgi:20S proteasome alpha/beta subunit
MKLIADGMHLVVAIVIVAAVSVYVSSVKSVVVVVLAQQQSQNPLTMNGGSVLAMAGKNCVVLAVDQRFGSGRSLINIRHRPILSLPSFLSMVAVTGMEGDVQSLYIELNAQLIDKYYRGLGFGERVRHHKIHQHDDTTSSSSLQSSLATTTKTTTTDVTSVAMLTSHILYRRKRAPYYVEPVVVGLKPDGWEEYAEPNPDELDHTNDSITTTSSSSSTHINHHSMSDAATQLCKNSNSHQSISESRIEHPNYMLNQRQQQRQRLRYRPYLCCMDMIGAKSQSEAFVCAGTACKSLYGTAEALWEPDMSPDELVSVCTNAFLSALERDCLSGYGATVYLLTPDGITEYDISGRSD